MTETATLTCSICAKNFDNRKSQLRHASYCRNAKDRVTSRKKACIACTKAKTRCEAGVPKCSRCVAKGITCVYPSGAARSIAVPTSSNLPRDREHDSITVAELQLPSAGSSEDVATRDINEITHIQHSTQVDPNHELSSSLDGVTWTLESEVSELTLPIQNPYTVAITSDSAPISQSSFHEITAGAPANVRLTSEANLSTAFSRFEYMGGLNAVERICKAFGPRNIQPSLNKSYLLCTLLSYHKMMLGGEPPPFIHRNYGYGIDAPAQVARPAPLKNCANIILWFTKKDKDNIGFIWRTVKAETDRLLEEHESYNGEDSVAAMQAMTLYLLLRISEENKTVTNFDIAMIKTMITIATRVNRRFPDYNKAFPDSMPSWEEWMIAESLRRTVTVLCLIELLFEMYSVIGIQGYDGSLLASLSLPCEKSLWRASTRSVWEEAYTAQRGTMGNTRHLRYNDLMNPQLQAKGTLDGWMTNLDEFGTLIMTAVGIQP